MEEKMEKEIADADDRRRREEGDHLMSMYTFKKFIANQVGACGLHCPDRMG